VQANHREISPYFLLRNKRRNEWRVCTTHHGGSETSVQSQDDELVEDRRVDVLQLLVREDSVGGGSLDLVPVTVRVVGRRDVSKVEPAVLTRARSSPRGD
jgi:hypothetical protein